VPVFKYPSEPQQNYTAMNYIKRLVGLPGETVAIYRGRLYVTKSLTYPTTEKYHRARPLDEHDLWEHYYTYKSDQEALELFETSQAAGFAGGAGGFEILRKPPAQIRAMARIVFDNDYQPRRFGERALPRWQEDEVNTWQRKDGGKVLEHTGAGTHWLHYQNLIPVANNTPASTPTEIRNFLGYNEGETMPPKERSPGENFFWVSDLMVECKATLGAAGDEVTLELSKGIDYFRAVFGNGKCDLYRFQAVWNPDAKGYTRVPGDKGQLLGSVPCSVKGAGSYNLCLANVDNRLTVWVNGSVLSFGAIADYKPADRLEHFEARDTYKEGIVEVNDLRAPAGIGASGSVTVSKVKLWRDTYYTSDRTVRFNGDGSPDRALVPTTVETYYVQPGHYLCLGDNSAASSDGRSWGLVPERLMLGRAIFVYWPTWPVNPVNRIGLIE
jgi:signal peptidase I